MCRCRVGVCFGVIEVVLVCVLVINSVCSLKLNLFSCVRMFLLLCRSVL